MRVRFAPNARAELTDILSMVRERSPTGARRISAKVRGMRATLAAYPNAGRQVDLAGVRVIVVRPFPYLLFYEVRDAEVVVVSIRHASRDPRTMPVGDEE